MAEPTAALYEDRPRTRARPLQDPTRFREPEVEAQIAALAAHSVQQLLQRVADLDNGRPGSIRPEVFVYFLRERWRSGDPDAAWAIAEAVVRRYAGFMAQYVGCWNLPNHQHTEECLRDIQVLVLNDLFDMSTTNEFWEVRFWLCLKRRVTNIVRRYSTAAHSEFTPMPVGDSGAGAEEFFERLPAPDRLPPPVRIQVREALAMMADRERGVFVLFHYEGWSQPDIASRLGVSERTVRNILSKAESRLARWREERVQ